MQDIVLISIPESSIRNIVEQAVRKAISETNLLSNPPEANTLLTRKEAAALVGVCLATIDNKVNAGVLPKYTTGGIVRFKRQEVIDAFSKSFSPNRARRKTQTGAKSPK